MQNRLALLVVIAAAIGLVLAGCGRGPGTDKMTEPPDEQPPEEQPPEEQPTMPSIDGTWVFTGFSAVIAVPDVTVTVGDGTNPLSDDPRFSVLTQIVAKGTIAMAGTAYKLTLAAGDDAITVKTTSDAPPGTAALAKGVIKGLIQDAQDGDVDITVSDDMMMITVKGSFLSMLAQAHGMPVPEEGLVGCKEAACSTTAS